MPTLSSGDGKTHYIKSQLEQCSDARTIAVNEAFTALNAINKLRSLPLTKKNCGIFFNFTVLPPGECVDESESERYQELLEVIGWFFFDLLLLGYVEDPPTGRSFRIPGSLGWAIFVEVCALYAVPFKRPCKPSPASLHCRSHLETCPFPLVMP